MTTTKSNNPSSTFRLNPAVLAALLTFLALALNSSSTLAQSSVEKAETSAQVQERVDELQRAVNVVTRGVKQEQPKTGRMIGDYSVNSSLEFGYRWTDVQGSNEKFLSDVNIREGLRLFNYSLDSRSVTGAGKLYDFLHAEASGAGGDPQQTFVLRMDKARAYKFDASVRRLNYFRYLPNFSANSHNIDTRQQLSDFSLKLLPQRKVRVNLGYNRAMQTGFSQLTTYVNGDLFADPGERRWESNNYRVGIDATHRGWDFFAEEMYRTYKWDTSYAWPGGVNPGVVGPNDLSTITFFTRPEATRSHGSVTRGSLAGSLAKRLHLVARGMYSEERMDGFLIESYAGTTTAANTKILSNVYSSNGYAKRPSTSVDAALSFDLTERLTLNNTFRYSDFTINGDAYVNTYRQQQNPNGTVTTTNPHPFAAYPNQVTALGFYGTRGTELSTVWNTVNLQYSLGKRLTANVGWRTTHRDVTLSELNHSEDETQNTNTGIGSIRFRPMDRLNLFFDYEKGESSNVFVRVAPMNFQRVRARASVEASEKLSFTATLVTNDRTNPTRFVENDQNSRSYSVSGLWQPNRRYLINAGYNYDHLAATANIYYFIATVPRTGRSNYYARQNFFFVDARVGITKYVDLLGVYRYVHDRGAPAVSGLGPNDFVTSFPLKRHNPEARLAVHVNPHATLNLSYRHYSYNERNFSMQDYRSNIFTTSLRYTF